MGLFGVGIIGDPWGPLVGIPLRRSQPWRQLKNAENKKQLKNAFVPDEMVEMVYLCMSPIETPEKLETAETGTERVATTNIYI